MGKILFGVIVFFAVIVSVSAQEVLFLSYSEAPCILYESAGYQVVHAYKETVQIKRDERILMEQDAHTITVSEFGIIGNKMRSGDFYFDFTKGRGEVGFDWVYINDCGISAKKQGFIKIIMRDQTITVNDCDYAYPRDQGYYQLQTLDDNFETNGQVFNRLFNHKGKLVAETPRHIYSYRGGVVIQTNSGIEIFSNKNKCVYTQYEDVFSCRETLWLNDGEFWNIMDTAHTVIDKIPSFYEIASIQKDNAVLLFKRREAKFFLYQIESKTISPVDNCTGFGMP